MNRMVSALAHSGSKEVYGDIGFVREGTLAKEERLGQKALIGVI